MRHRLSFGNEGGILIPEELQESHGRQAPLDKQVDLTRGGHAGGGLDGDIGLVDVQHPHARNFKLMFGEVLKQQLFITEDMRLDQPLAGSPGKGGQHCYSGGNHQGGARTRPP